MKSIRTKVTGPTARFLDAGFLFGHDIIVGLTKSGLSSSLYLSLFTVDDILASRRGRPRILIGNRKGSLARALLYCGVIKSRLSMDIRKRSESRFVASIPLYKSNVSFFY